MLPEVHEVRLDNGFRALLVERHSLPVVASMVWYQVGSRDERTGETGLSHFLEHMMFKGTDRFAKGEIDLITSKLGGSNNAFTDTDVTAYYFSLASDRWETALEIEANRMQGCLLDPREFEAEKMVVLEEMAMGEDDPWRRLHHAVEASSYQIHPYHHPIIGWREDVEGVDIDTMRAYYQRHYGPNRAFLVAVGDLDARKTGRRIRELFGKLPKVESRSTAIAELPQSGERRAVVRFPGSLTRMAFAFQACRMGEPDDFVYDVISYVLGSGKSSRLNRRLVLEEQLVTHVSVYNEVRQDPGLFWIAVEPREGVDPHKVEDIVREEIQRLIDGGASAAELRRTRTQLRAGYLFDEETALDLAMKIGRFQAMTERGYRLLDDVLSSYEAVSSKRVREVAARTFAPDRWTVLWSMPEEAQPTRRKPRKKARKKASAKRKAKPMRRTRSKVKATPKTKAKTKTKKKSAKRTE